LIVLDAAALVDVVTDQPDRGWVLEQIEDEDIAAPSHQLAEVVSAVARLVRADVLSLAAARDALGEAGALEQNLVAPSTTHLRRALELQERVRVLDGLYIALAEEFDVPLVTTDRRLRGADLPVEVLTP
jgi:predicted nucleic acid-binding protein